MHFGLIPKDLLLLVSFKVCNMLGMLNLMEFVPNFRQLHLILSMLVQRDEDVKSEVTANKEKEIISTITSIFQNIKHSEDVVDASKSKVEGFFFF